MIRKRPTARLDSIWELNDPSTMATIRRSVKRGLFQIGATLLALLVLCSCEEYPSPYAQGPGFYPRAAPAGWWNEDGASGSFSDIGPRKLERPGHAYSSWVRAIRTIGQITMASTTVKITTVIALASPKRPACSGEDDEVPPLQVLHLGDV